MKNGMYFLVCFLYVTTVAMSQGKSQDRSLQTTSIASYPIEITHNKTTHLVFPYPITYVDLGSNEIIASTVENAPSVLRIKAVHDSIRDTNFTVITRAADFYGFDVTYTLNPKSLSYDLSKLTLGDNEDNTLLSNSSRSISSSLKTDIPAVSIKGLEPTSLKQIEAVAQQIIEINPKDLYIMNKDNLIKTSLKSIYFCGSLLYFFIEIQPKQVKGFKLDQIRCYVLDEPVFKGVVTQEKTVEIIYQRLEDKGFDHSGKKYLVFITENFELYKGQSFQIELKHSDELTATALIVKPWDFSRLKRWRKHRGGNNGLQLCN